MSMHNLKKAMRKSKNPKARCPNCNKKMLWIKPGFDYFWQCTDVRRCKTSARDDKGTFKLSSKNISLLEQWQYLEYLHLKELRLRILLRLIVRKGLSNLSQKVGSKLPSMDRAYFKVSCISTLFTMRYGSRGKRFLSFRK